MEIGLYSKQRQSLESAAVEVLMAGTQGGKSHGGRVSLIATCMAHPGTVTAIVAPRQREIVKEHIEGRTGIKTLLAKSPAAATYGIGEMKFENGSILMWAGADRPADIRRLVDRAPTMVFFDDLHRIPREMYESITSRVEVNGGRVVSACPPIKESGWVAEYWSTVDPKKVLIETSSDDLPETLRQIETIPTLEEFMDGLGVPFLAAGSAFRKAPYVRHVVQFLQRWFWGEFLRAMILMPTQHGKACRLDTPILTTTGWSTMGDLKVGDEIFAIDGTPTKVTHKSPVMNEEEYRVTSDDGYSVVCHAEHEWVVTLDKRTGWKRKTTKYLHDRGPARNSSRAPRLHIHGPVQRSPLRSSLLVDPWVLGFTSGNRFQ